MTTFVDFTRFQKTGIALALYPVDEYADCEIQRAPDDGGGDPDVGNAVVIAATPPGKQFFVDELALDGENRHYRHRHVDGFATPSDWTSWVVATPIEIPDPLPPIPLDPAMDLDMFIDPLTGEITLVVNASSVITLVKWDLAINSGSFPDATAGTDQVTVDGDATIVVPTGTYIATAGDNVKAAVAYYREDGSLAGILRREDVMQGQVSASPTLDIDGTALSLFPNRSSSSLAGYWKTYTSGTPTKSDVLNTGTLSTAAEILVHTFTTNGETVKVGFVPTAAADGSGATGDLWYQAWKFDAGAVNPEAWFESFIPTTDNKEGVRMWARDPSAQVRIRYRQFTFGDSPPGFSDTGLSADPLAFELEVTRPAESAASTIVEFYGENAGGFTSHPSDAPVRVEIDGNLRPSGSYQTDLDRSTGEPSVAISTADPDTGSWRLRVSKTDYQALSFSDTASDEFSGNTFNGETPSLSDFKLAKDEILYCTLQFFRTTVVLGGTQTASMQSDTERFPISMAEETENSIRVQGFDWYLIQTAGGPTWKFGVTVCIKSNVRALTFQYDFYDASEAASTPVAYTLEVTPGQDGTFILQDATGASDQIFEEGDGIGSGSPPFIFSTSVIITPYPTVLGVEGNTWTDICWSPELELFCAVSQDTEGNKVMTSPDGINWDIRQPAADLAWQSVCWSPALGLFCSVATGKVTNAVMTSPDGIKWTRQTVANDSEWYGVCWSPDEAIFMAVGQTSAGGPNSQTGMWSADGESWTVATLPNGAPQYRSVVWAPGLSLFVAVAFGSVTEAVATSPDGITWTSRDASESNEWTDVCWNEDDTLLVAVSKDGTNRVMTSPDGINWTSETAAAQNDWRSVVWADSLNLFVAVCRTGDEDERVMTSPDGAAWTIRTTPGDVFLALTGNWLGICWNPDDGILAAVAGSGDLLLGKYLKVMTSTDAIAWASREQATAAAGQSRIFDPPDYEGVGAHGAAITNGVDIFRGDMEGLGFGQTLLQDGDGRPSRDIDPGQFVFFQSGNPSDPVEGAIWFDSNASPPDVKRYNGSTWDTLGSLA